MRRTNDEKIDFVVFWVDGGDPNWIAEKTKWERELSADDGGRSDCSEIRYRDWGLMRYWFRGVEKYAPWVNQIHFVTCGQTPEWLNVNHPKLHLVKHSDYMPKDALPTFNSNAIEISMYKIPSLTEKFVAFNDDFFIINTVKPTDFFKNGKPVNLMSLHPVFADVRDGFYKILQNNMEVINDNFSFSDSVRDNISKYLTLKQGKYLFRTIPLLNYKKFAGFATYHMPIAYLKSTHKEVWGKIPDRLNKTLYSRFRSFDADLSHWVFSYWQFAKGDFYQKSPRHERHMFITDLDAVQAISSQKYNIIGLGDSKDVCNFEEVRTRVAKSFEKILPNRSEFENEA